MKNHSPAISFVLLLLGLCVLFTLPAEAQVYGSNLFELQYGNLPYQEDRDLITTYNQTDIYYDSKPIYFHGRVEHFLTPHRNRNYLQLTQKKLEYDGDEVRIRLGNFYETIGRGLLLRSYAIPGSVYEDEFYRTRYAFYRDLEGIAVEFNNEWMEAKLLRARPLFNPLPPNFKPDTLRRPDLAEALEVEFSRFKNLTIGAAYMRNHPDNQNGYNEYASIMANANLPYNLQLYTEYAFDTGAELLGFKKSDTFGLYSGLNFSYESLGASLEYKNYNKFRLGSGAINNPPSLIKEHTYPVLNRSTHVLETSNETGFQGELFYNFSEGHSVVLNVTQAQNDLVKDFHYSEFFVEGTYFVSDALSFKAFLDYAQDELKGEENRWSMGVVADKSYQFTWNVSLDVQYQRFERPFTEGAIENWYGAVSVSHVPDLTVSAVFEASSDPILTDNPNTTARETDTRTWLGGNIRYQFNSSNTVSLFAGKRRGGPACTSGICYEILDFEGVELRLTTRF